MGTPVRPRRPRPPRPAPPAPAGAEVRPLPQVLRQAWYGLNQAFRRRIAHLSLTPDQYIVLRNLDESGPAGLTQSELTTRMASDPNTIASLVERMNRAGVVRRETDPADRRARRLRLAPAGRARLKAARKVALALQTEIVSQLTDSERETLLALLEKLADTCQAAAEGD